MDGVETETATLEPSVYAVRISETKLRMRLRLWLLWEHLLNLLGIVVLWGGNLLAGYAVVWMAEWVASDLISSAPFLALTLRRGRIGLALLAIVIALVHTGLSTIKWLKKSRDFE